jgi:hypothetical protein
MTCLVTKGGELSMTKFDDLAQWQVELAQVVSALTPAMWVDLVIFSDRCSTAVTNEALPDRDAEQTRRPASLCRFTMRQKV